MKQIIGVNIGSYSFDKTAKTVTLSGISGTIHLEWLLTVINVNSNIIIYQPNKTGYGATLVGYVFTLDYDTSSMNNSDELMIIIDLPDLPLPTGNNIIGKVSIDQTTPGSTNGITNKNTDGVIINPATEESVSWIKRLFKRLSSLGITDSSGRQRIVVDGSVTVAQATASNLTATVSIASAQTLATVTTVGTLTDITSIGSNGARVFQNSLSRNTYANNTRSHLSF